MEELADKLKSYARQLTAVREKTDFSFSENITPGIILSPIEALNIYRDCQEAVNNVMKHASADELMISLDAVSETDFSICIADNGTGFEPAQVSEGHYGLENMQLRAAELNATLTVTSVADKGTTVILKKLLK